MAESKVDLSDDLKHNVVETARRRGLSEAEFLREAIQAAVDQDQVPKPEVGFLYLGDGPSDLSQRVDEVLAETGFGEW